MYPLSKKYTPDKPKKVDIPRLVLTPSNEFGLLSAILHIKELHCYNRGAMRAQETVGTVVEELHCCSETGFRMSGDVNIKRIVGQFCENGGRKFLSSGSIGGLKHYCPDLLKDAGECELYDCFHGITLDTDVIFGERVKLSYSFKDATLNGDVVLGNNSIITDSFNRSTCKNVSILGGNEDNPYYQGQISSSFQDTTILGDVDIRRTRSISGSFTGEIAGTVHFSPDLSEMSRKCFTNYRDKNFTINAGGDKFRAGLENPQAILTVNGNEGTFTNVDVAELYWNTTAKSVAKDTFFRVQTLPSNKLESIEVLEGEAISGYLAKSLDFGLFPNLKELASKAVFNCENLSSVIIDGPIKLTTSSFSKCPKLAHIFIGDDVKGVMASAFSGVAPQIHIYYDKNKEVEKLGRIPRFILHPNSKPEDTQAHLEERAEMLETVGVVATFANVEGIGYRVNDKERLLAQGVILALNETGMCSDLATKFPVTPRCEKPVKELAWAVNLKKSDPYPNNAKREELVRLLAAMATLTYPYCEEVFNLKALSGNKTIESDKYAFICGEFLISGVTKYAYVLVDKATDTIIHAFTFGSEKSRDELSDIASYLTCAVSDDPCALLRYAEDVRLVSWRNDIFEMGMYEKIQRAVCNSWLPFGSYKSGQSVAMYGVDLSTGNFVSFKYTGKTYLRAGTISAGRHLSDWWASRLESTGVVGVGDPNTLIPLMAGGADEDLARYNHSVTDRFVTTVDTGKIPVATDINLAKTLLSVMTQAKVNITAKQYTELLAKSELYQKDSKVVTSMIFGGRVEEHTTNITGGKVAFYSFDKTQYSLVSVYDEGSNKTVWYIGIGRVMYIQRLLQAIVASEGKVPNMNLMKHHFTVDEGYREMDILPLTGKFGNDWLYPSPSFINRLSATSTVWLGVSPVSFKACLYFQKISGYTITPDNKPKSVMFWFNSIKSACKAAGVLGFSPFASVTDTNNRWSEFSKLEADYRGFADSQALRNTIRALREGRPDGYILKMNSCKQVLFDLACKQPKNI